MTLRKTWLASWVLVAGWVLAGCSQQPDDFGQAAQDYAVHFQDRAERGEFATLYAEGSPRMKQAARETDFVGLLAKVRQAMGERKGSTFQRSEPAQTPDGAPLSRLVYDSEFANGKAVESFYFDNVDGKPRLFHYQIDSPVLNDLVAALEKPVFEDPFGQAMLASIERFHAQVAANDLARIYDTGAPGMREGVARQDFIDSMTRVQAALGTLRESAPQRRATTEASDGMPLVVVDMRSVFAQDQGRERFYFQHADGQPLLYRYEVYADVLAKAVAGDSAASASAR